MWRNKTYSGNGGKRSNLSEAMVYRTVSGAGMKSKSKAGITPVSKVEPKPAIHRHNKLNHKKK